MDSSERIVYEYLSNQGFSDVAYEPDGNVPPDFLLNGRIAVEVRRLNQNEDTGDGPHGLEETAIPLQAKVRKLLATLGSSNSGESWFVIYSFRRPLPPWDQLANVLRSDLATFQGDSEHQPTSRGITAGFNIRLIRTSDPHADSFVFGGYIDLDSGGFILSEMDRNIRICVAEKTKRTAHLRERYPHWWLMLVDRIGYGRLTELDHERLRQLLQLDHSWDKIILINPLDATQGYEL
jgi:hypothetical protein